MDETHAFLILVSIMFDDFNRIMNLRWNMLMYDIRMITDQENLGLKV